MSVCRFTTCLSWLTSLGECCTASNSAYLYMRASVFRREKALSHLEMYFMTWFLCAGTPWTDEKAWTKSEPAKSSADFKQNAKDYHLQTSTHPCLLNISLKNQSEKSINQQMTRENINFCIISLHTDVENGSFLLCICWVFYFLICLI